MTDPTVLARALLVAAASAQDARPLIDAASALLASLRAATAPPRLADGA